MNRREFITGAVGTAALAGCASLARSARPEPAFIWSYLAHFGINSWKDVPLETQDPSKSEHWLTRCMADHVRFDEAVWRRTADALRKAGCNQIVIDLAEIVEYPSHPELAVKGTWSVEKLRAELARLRGMGFEVIPKLNFSACHDSWLKDYHRMVSTRKYYQVCADLIRDCAEIFDRPRFFHLGYDEENAGNQRDHLTCIIRQGDLWWHDLNFFFETVEKNGMRPWMWSDYGWTHTDEFLKRMSKAAVQSNWYYGARFDTGAMPADSRQKERVLFYDRLAKAGFDQVPTGSNWSCAENFPRTVDYCDARVAPANLLGYQMAPWQRTIPAHEEKAMDAVRIMGETVAKRSAR